MSSANRRRTQHTPSAEATLRAYVLARSPGARLLLGVAAGVGGGVLAVGATASLAHAANPVDAAGRVGAAAANASASGLTLQSSSKVRILAGRETDFWLEGPGAEEVTKATFEFVGADGAPVLLEADRAGTEADPAVTYVFESVGPDLPVRVTIERGGESEVLETTVEVIAVDTVNEEIEPPPGSNAGSADSGANDGGLPSVPGGAETLPSGPTETTEGGQGTGEGADRGSGTTDDPTSGTGADGQPSADGQPPAADGQPTAPTRTIEEVFDLPPEEIRNIITNLDITDGLTPEEIAAAYRVVGNDGDEYVQLLLTNDRWFVQWDGQQFVVIDRRTGAVLMTQDQFPPELAYVVSMLEVDEGEAKSFDPGDGALTGRLDSLFDDFGDADVEDTDIDVDANRSARDIARELLAPQDPTLPEDFDIALVEQGTDDDRAAVQGGIDDGGTPTPAELLAALADADTAEDFVREILGDGRVERDEDGNLRLVDEDGNPLTGPMYDYLLGLLAPGVATRRDDDDDDDDSSSGSRYNFDDDDDDDDDGTDDDEVPLVIDDSISDDDVFKELVGIVDPSRGAPRTLSSTGNGDIEGGFGDDEYTGLGQIDDSTIDLDRGNDKGSVIGDFTRTTFELGDDDDQLQILGRLNSSNVGGSGGNDMISVTGEMNDAELFGGDGDDTIGVDATMNGGAVNGDDGNDKIAVGGNVADAWVRGGKGDDEIVVGGNVTRTVIDLGEGLDTLVLAENFRGDVTVLDPLKGRVQKDGDDLREQDALVLQGDGWVQIDEFNFERRDADGNVIAHVNLGGSGEYGVDGDRGDVDDVEYVVSMVGENVINEFRNIDPEVDSDFWGDVLTWTGRALGVAGVITGNVWVLAATAAVNTGNAVYQGNTLGIIFGAASTFAPFIGEGSALFSDIVSGIQGGTMLLASGFDLDSILGAVSTGLRVGGQEQASLGVDLVNTAASAVDRGELTVDDALAIFGNVKRLDELANPPITVEDITKALANPTLPESQEILERAKFGFADTPLTDITAPTPKTVDPIKIPDDSGTLIAGDPTAAGTTSTPADALQVIQNQLGVDRETLLQYADPAAYRPTDGNVEEANRYARMLGFASFSDLAGKYLVDPQRPPDQEYMPGQERIEAPDPNATPYLDFFTDSNLVKNDVAAANIPSADGTFVLPDTVEGGRQYAAIGMRRLDAKYQLPLPDGVSEEFEQGYREVTGARAINSAWSFVSGVAGAKAPTVTPSKPRLEGGITVNPSNSTPPGSTAQQPTNSKPQATNPPATNPYAITSGGSSGGITSTAPGTPIISQYNGPEITMSNNFSVRSGSSNGAKPFWNGRQPSSGGQNTRPTTTPGRSYTQKQPTPPPKVTETKTGVSVVASMPAGDNITYDFGFVKGPSGQNYVSVGVSVKPLGGAKPNVAVTPVTSDPKLVQFKVGDAMGPISATLTAADGPKNNLAVRVASPDGTYFEVKLPGAYNPADIKFDSGYSPKSPGQVAPSGTISESPSGGVVFTFPVPPAK